MTKKMKSTSKLLTLSVLSAFLAVFLLGFASASVDLSIVNAPSEANHNSDMTITFNVTSTGENYTQLDWSQSATNIGSWKSLPESVALNDGETRVFSAILNVPAHASGTINAVLNVVASTENQYSTEDQESIQITIKNSPRLSVSSKTISSDVNTTTITIKNEGNTHLSNINLTASGSFDVELSQTLFSLAKGASQEITVTRTTPFSSLHTGENTVILTAKTGDVSASGAVRIIKSFCRDGSTGFSGNDLILDVSVRNRGQGTDEEWRPLDRITVEVRLNNNLDEELRDVVFMLGLIEKGTTRNIIEDMMWVSSERDEYEIGDIREGRSSSRYTFEFIVNPEEVRLDRTYGLFVKAFPDGRESTTCIDYSTGLRDIGSSEFFAEVEVVSETSRDKMVVIDDFNLQKEIVKAQCGQDVLILANVYNIGDLDFEDRIKVRLVNTELGIDVEDEIITDLYSGDRITANLNFKIPRDAEEKVYTLSMRTFYDYRESDGTYRRYSDKEFQAYLEVEGNCIVIPPVIVLTKSESDAVEGENFTLDISLINTKSIPKNFVVELSEFEEWAELLTPLQPVFVDAEESKEFSLMFKLKEESFGEKSFNISIYSDGELIAIQPVSLSVKEAPKKSLFGIEGFALTGDNWYLWALGLLNVIVVVAIIVVVVRLMKK